MQGDPKGKEDRTVHIHIYTSTHHTCNTSHLTAPARSNCIDIHTGPDGVCIPPANTQRMLLLLPFFYFPNPSEASRTRPEVMGGGGGPGLTQAPSSGFTQTPFLLPKSISRDPIPWPVTH